MNRAQNLLLDSVERVMSGSTMTYHNMDHIRGAWASYCSRFNRIEQAVTLAIFYHDSIYVPGFKQNEEASAALLMNSALRCGIQDEDDWGVVMAACEYIKATTLEHHLGSRAPLLLYGNVDEWNCVMDADLSSLAPNNYEVFVRTQRAIAQEHVVLSEDNRSAVERVAMNSQKLMEAFNAKERIFRTNEFSNLEAKAREHIHKYMFTPAKTIATYFIENKIG